MSASSPVTSVPEDGAHAALEQQLRRIWSAVLGLEPSTPTENFFDLGGHSFLAIQVILRVREELGVVLPFVAFLEGPTLREQARLVHSLRASVPA